MCHAKQNKVFSASKSNAISQNLFLWRRSVGSVLKNKSDQMTPTFSRHQARPASCSPLQLAGVPDQMPSAWHSLMPVPCSSKSGWQRTPQAASKWLLHTFWMKKPFSGGDSAGQYTTGRRGWENNDNTPTHTESLLVWNADNVESLCSLSKLIKKTVNAENYRLSNIGPQCTQREEEKAKRRPREEWLMKTLCVQKNCCVEITGSFLKEWEEHFNYWKHIQGVRDSVPVDS